VFPEGRTPSTPENWERDRDRDRIGVMREGDGREEGGSEAGLDR
jgi:hypothetical protein